MADHPSAADPSSASDLAIPAVLDDITTDWVDRALRVGAPDPAHSLEVEVEAVRVEPLGANVGLLGDLARLHLRYRRGVGPSTMIAKLPATDPGGRQVGTMLRAWAREVAFYQDLAPASAGADLPACHHAAGDDDAGAWVLLLADVAGDTLPADVGATEAQAQAAVDALARFHAAWWQAPRQFAWMPGFDTTGVGGLQGAWLDALPRFLHRYHHVVPDPTGDWITRFAPRLSEWSDSAAAEPLTVVHADYRLDNLLLATGDDGEVGVTMLDWQTALRGPAAMDLTCFCVTALTIEDRRRTEGDLIARYLDALAGHGVTVDAGWFARSYDENLLWWMGQFANNLSRLEPDDATQRSLDTMIERTYTAGLDHDVGRLLDQP